MTGDQARATFLSTVRVGDVLTGTVVEFVRSEATVSVDGLTGGPVGVIGALDLTWGPWQEAILAPGDRVAAEVIGVDRVKGQVRLSRAATEHPRLWAFLKALRPGQLLSGTVAAVERFGVFVDLDDGPDHPCFPGVGFVTMPELSWRHFEDPAEVVTVGRRVTGELLQFDTTNGEARLSLRATQPDPFPVFARSLRVGQTLHGPITKVVPFGAFVRVADGIEALIHLDDLADTPGQTAEQALRAVQAGDDVVVTVKEIDLSRRRLLLSRR